MSQHITQKDGASNHARPAVCPAEGRCTAGADNSRAKLRALAEAMGGPCFVRFDDGRTAILSAEALKFIPFHGGMNA